MKQKAKSEHVKKADFVGKWRITKMSEWDNDYIDVEVKAYIDIKKSGSGDFQFGLVSGSLYGKFKTNLPLFDFTWDGGDDNDTASGDGWITIVSNRKAEGEIRFHAGDTSKFWARKIKAVSKNGKR